MLECQSVTVIFDDFIALDGINLKIGSGDYRGVIGPNGAGKSTLIKVMSGVLEPTRGFVHLDRVNLRSLSRRQIASKLALVVQEEDPGAVLTVAQYVALGRSPHHGGLYFENHLDRDVIEEAMVRTKTDHLSTRQFGSLSGGEKQRVRIARALAQEPEILILDEPTNHLDLYSQMNLIELLDQINHNGISLMIVSHDINFICGTRASLTMMNHGRIVAEGSSREVVTEGNLARAFGIRALVDTNPVTMAPRITPLGKI